ncbi:MAG: hypothetical protein QOH25_960 [Acidobacteriota bacterium]|nr:hypothetical protein [Acidobacteriota bacterium]
MTGATDSSNFLLEACPRSPLREQAPSAPTTTRVADPFKKLSNIRKGQRDALVEHDAELRAAFDYSLLTF